MSLLRYPWTINQGADFPFLFTWSTGAPAQPVNLTGCTASLMIRQLATDTAPVVSISTTANAQGAIVLGGLLGTIQIAITRAATLALPTGGFTASAAAVQGLWLNWQIFVTFPANSQFPAGQTIPLADGPVWVIASANH